MARSKGTGGITRLEQLPKAKCRRWRLNVVRDGKRLQRRFCGTYAQAERALAEWEYELEAPEPCEDITFREYAERWHARRAASGEFAAQTMAGEVHNVRRLCHAFGDMPLRSIGREEVQDGMASLRDGDNPTGRPLSGTTMNKTFAVLRHIMSEAVLSDLVPKNPTDGLKRPRRDTPEKRAMGMDEVRRFLGLLELRPLDGRTVSLRLMVLAGLRRSEAVGVEWRDVQGGMVRVRRSVSELDGMVKEPKSAAGVRSVPMLPQLAAALDAWRVEQAAQLAALGLEQTPLTPVATSSTGTRLSAQNLWRWWDSAKLELGADCTLHELRHTFLTMLANSGASAQALKSVAGWSSIEMANVYVHDDEAANRQAVGALADRFEAVTLQGVAGGTFERNATQRAATQNQLLGGRNAW